MSFKFRHMEKIVGFFMLAGILILLITIIFMGREQRWFEQKFYLRTVFNSGKGLNRGMDVKINGLTVGNVTHIYFNNENKIEVKFTVFSEYIDKIRQNSYVFREAPLIGSGFLNITLGTRRGSPVGNNAYLYSQDSTIVQDLIDRDEIQKEKSAMDKIMRNINQLTLQLSSSRGPLFGTLDNLRTLTGKLANNRGSLGALLGDNRQIYHQLLATMTSLKKIAQDISVLSGALKDSADNVRSIIANTDKGVKETTKVMVGLQQYFMISPDKNNGASRPKQNRPASLIDVDRRGKDY